MLPSLRGQLFPYYDGHTFYNPFSYFQSQIDMKIYLLFITLHSIDALLAVSCMKLPEMNPLLSFCT